MKRAYRTIAAVFAAVLVLSTVLMRFAWNVSAADSVILMVTGYKINDPREASMPFFRNGQLYTPVEMFTTLGLTANEQETTVILSNMKSGRILLFDAVSGMATDAEGVYTATAVRKNGLWFVPAEFTSARLDLIYAYHDVAPAPFVRITYPDDNLMSSDSFLRYYRSTAPEILNRFAPATTTLATTASRVTTPATTAPLTQITTPPSSAATTLPTTPPTTPRQPERYRVFWVVESLTDADAMLAALRACGASAVFCVNPSEVAESGDTLRKIAAEGHAFAFVGNANTTPEALESANDSLFAHTRCVTRLVFWQGTPNEAANRELYAAGYAVQTPHATVKNTSAGIAEICDLLEARNRAMLSVTEADAVNKLHTAIAKEEPTYPQLSAFGWTE